MKGQSVLNSDGSCLSSSTEEPKVENHGLGEVGIAGPDDMFDSDQDFVSSAKKVES